MSIRKLIVALLAILILAGCSAPASAPAAAPAAAQPAATEAQTIDVASLPRDVDVQTTAALREQPDVMILDVREQDEWDAQPDVMILDVREQDEWDAGHIPGAVFMPMGQVPDRLSEIPKDKTVIVQCRSGNRSSQVTARSPTSWFSRALPTSTTWQAVSMPGRALVCR